MRDVPNARLFEALAATAWLRGDGGPATVGAWREHRAQPSAEPPAPVERAKGKARVRQGVVVSDRAEKTITVRVDITRQHRTYGKVVRTSSTLHAHDESNSAHIGDKVRVVEILERAR